MQRRITFFNEVEQFNCPSINFIFEFIHEVNVNTGNSLPECAIGHLRIFYQPAHAKNLDLWKASICRLRVAAQSFQEAKTFAGDNDLAPSVSALALHALANYCLRELARSRHWQQLLEFHVQQEKKDYNDHIYDYPSLDPYHDQMLEKKREEQLNLLIMLGRGDDTASLLYHAITCEQFEAMFMPDKAMQKLFGDLKI